MPMWHTGDNLLATELAASVTDQIPAFGDSRLVQFLHLTRLDLWHSPCRVELSRSLRERAYADSKISAVQIRW